MVFIYNPADNLENFNDVESIILVGIWWGEGKINS